jgi:hypothetical protein
MEEKLATRVQGILEAIRALLQSASVELAYLFGSAASGLDRADSDLDIAVLLSRSVPRERHAEIRLRLTTELVGLTHTNDVDVVVLNEAPPLLAHQVITKGRVLLGERRVQTRFEVNAIQRYIDTKLLREYCARALERRLSRPGGDAEDRPNRPW